MSYTLDEFNGYLVNIENGLPENSFKKYVCQILHGILNEKEKEEGYTFANFKHDYLRYKAVEDGTFANLIWSEDIENIFKCYSKEIVNEVFEMLCLHGADLTEFKFPVHIDMTRSAFHLVMSSLVDDFVLGGLDNE